jgi:hypothetical protein
MKILNLKSIKKLSLLLGATGLTLMISLFGTSSAANADCLYQYNSNGFTTSATPVFDSICGVPYGINNENNFVRIRQNSNGNDEDNQNNPLYTVGTLNSACTTGSKYDIWNYVHNNASQNFNPDVGNGSAVAHNVAIDMTAPLGTTSNNFSFGATISASNAASISDSAILNCGSNNVKLSIVPGTVHIYSEPYGGWQSLPDAVINNNTPIGSTNAGLNSMSSGNMWGCWTYRIVIVYQVQVTTVPAQVVMPTCNLLTLENDNGVARIDSIGYTANSASVTGYNILITNGNTTDVNQNIGLNQLPYNYTMTAGNTYNFKATVLTSLGNVTSNNCEGVLTVNSVAPTPTPPVITPTTTTPPAQLVNTGPGSTIAIFGGATAVGTALYYWFIRKRITKH